MVVKRGRKVVSESIFGWFVGGSGKSEAIEETMADAFATHYLAYHLPERALDVLTAHIATTDDARGYGVH